MTTKQSIVQLLKTNDKAVARALVALNERQTADEQAAENTRYHNGRGFRPCHARMGTSMAQFYLKRGYLSPKQVAYWRHVQKDGKMRIEIYAGQLLEVAQVKEAAKTNTGSYAAVAASNSNLVRVNGEFVRKPVDDVGNMMEEKMVLQEKLATMEYEYGMCQDSDFVTVLEPMAIEIAALRDRIDMLGKEIVRAYQEMGNVR